jgi:hypothetical protein
LAQFLMMPAIGVGTLYLRHRRLPPGVAPSRLQSVALWIGATVLVGFVVVYLATLPR